MRNDRAEREGSTAGNGPGPDEGARRRTDTGGARTGVPILRRVLLFFSYLLVTAIVLFVFVFYPGINGYYRAMFPDMISGRAYRPFVGRALLPRTVEAISRATPDRVRKGIRVAPRNRRFLLQLGWEQEFLYEYFVALLLMFSCFFGFAVLTRSLIRTAYGFPDFVADMAPAASLLLLPVFFRYQNYIYDPSTLFLSALAVFAALKRSRPLFYAAFLLACFNKETAVLLCGFFFIVEREHLESGRLSLHLLGQAALWAAIRGLLFLQYRHNPGSTTEFHLLDHNVALLHQPGRLAWFIGAVALFSVLVRRRWDGKPRALRLGLVVTLLPLAAFALFFGYIDELRGYYEAFPFLVLLSVPTIVEVFDMQCRQEAHDQTLS